MLAEILEEILEEMLMQRTWKLIVIIVIIADYKCIILEAVDLRTTKKKETTKEKSSKRQSNIRPNSSKNNNIKQQNEEVNYWKYHQFYRYLKSIRMETKC